MDGNMNNLSDEELTELLMQKMRQQAQQVDLNSLTQILQSARKKQTLEESIALLRYSVTEHPEFEAILLPLIQRMMSKVPRPTFHHN